MTWDPPDTTKQNGVIISYTSCVSHSKEGLCFQTFITSERKWLVGNLNSSKKYYVRVFASTKVDHGSYSESKGFFTNESKYNNVYIAILRKSLCRIPYLQTHAIKMLLAGCYLKKDLKKNKKKT